MTPGLVSVVVPAYNAQDFLEEAVTSALRQQYRRLEILVVNHGSTDGTRAVIDRMVAADARVRAIEMAVNTGRPAVARNRGIAVASGEYVAFLDADDTWTSWKLADQVSAMEAHPDVVLVYSVLRFFGELSLTSSAHGLMPFPMAVSLDLKSLEGKDTIPLSGSLCRASALGAIGGFDEREEFGGVEDYDLFLRLAEQGSVAFVPRIHGGYRVHRGGMSRNSDVQSARICRLLTARGAAARWHPFPRYSTGTLVARNLVHMAAAAALMMRERIERTCGRRLVPVRRARVSA